MRIKAKVRVWKALAVIAGLVTGVGIFAVVAPTTSSAATYAPRSIGGLDCNGFSPVQQSVIPPNACTDIRGLPGADNANSWGGRFYDNGHYIGHDEPDMTFLSSQAGSGNDVTWNETLGSDPNANPTVKTPGRDVSHYVELTVAPWFSMALCNGESFPELPCTPNSDSNAPACVGLLCSPTAYPGAGSSFLEMQFYPPGLAPFPDSISCDNTHWCASLHINDLECPLSGNCNPNCTEPTNFAFIQTDGVPTGPPSPQLSDLATSTPDAHTLLMNPGDNLTIHISDQPVPGESGVNALETQIVDNTTGQTGFMQASAKNGFAATSINDCSGTPFNYEPEYSTASAANIVPWAALLVNVSTEFEIGHFTPCTFLTHPATLALGPGVTDTYWNACHGPYENSAPGGDGKKKPEVSDALCFPAGDTHGVLNSAPNVVTGCDDNFFQNGDLDFDGSGYWPEWPTGPAPTASLPGSFQQSFPSSAGNPYSDFFFQTDTALSESTCTASAPSGCAVPPPNAPGRFYPYWSRADVGGVCTIEFGNVSSGAGVDPFGRDAQYGTNQAATLGYQEFEGPLQSTTCP